MAGRIRIEPYQPLDVHTPPVPAGGYIKVDASAGDFGQSLGDGLQKFGAGLQQATKDVGKLLEQVRDNEAIVKSADSRLGQTEQALLFDPQQGYLTTHGKDAVDRAETVLLAYTKAHEREAVALANDEQRRMFDDISPRRVASFTDQVQRHSAAERLRWHDEAGDARIALAQADAGLHWNDDTMLRRSLGTARAEVRDKAERNGWDAALTNALLSRETSAILVSAIGAAAEHDPDRAAALRLRYDPVLVERDRLGLDAMLDEALGRRDAQQASDAIRAGKSPAPSDDSPAAPAPPLNPRTDRPTLEWQLERAEAIPEPSTRARTAARLRSANAADEAAAESRERELGEQVLSQVTKNKLTDPSQIPVGDWIALDTERRQSIGALLGHNLRGDEPKSDPTLFNQLTTEITRAPRAFAQRDLVPFVGRLPTAQWQRLRDWQAGLRRNDPTTEDELYAIKRGLQIAGKTLPDSDSGMAEDNKAARRADLVEEIDTWRRINGKSPDDIAIRAMLDRQLAPVSLHNVVFPFDPKIDPPIHAVKWERAFPKGADKEAVALFLLFLSFMEAIIIHQKGSQRLPSPSQDQAYPPPAPPPTEGWPSVERTPAPNVPEVAQWRDALPPDLAEALKKPETFPQAPPIPPLPPTSIPEPQRPSIISTPIPPPGKPEILSTPIPPPAKPQIMESRGGPGDNDELWDEHHHIPQELWQHDAPNRIPFSPHAVKLFKKETVRIPNDEHWSDLHAAYNRAFRRAARAYLAKEKKADETEDDFAGRMSEIEAHELYKDITRVILNPPEDLKEEEAKDAKHAREFFMNVIWYVRK